MDDVKEVEETVIALVAQAAPGKLEGAANLTTELSLRRDLGLDSLGLATLFFHFGEALGKDPDELMELIADASINTVGDMVTLGARILHDARSASGASAS